MGMKAPARWLENGELKEVPAGGALLDSARPLNFLPGFNLEGYPNRDSTVYTSKYGIEDAHTVLRGTIRLVLILYICRYSPEVLLDTFHLTCDNNW